MRPLNVVVAQLDSKNAERLASSLHSHFHAVAVARSLEELSDAIPRNQADVAVVDLELVSLSDLENLHHHFKDVSIVCTHRVADEEMWTSALAAGASDMCSSADVDNVVHCALRSRDALAASKAA
jgi:DNA-binding NarL/FixJ family response regulator